MDPSFYIVDLGGEGSVTLITCAFPLTRTARSSKPVFEVEIVNSMWKISFAADISKTISREAVVLAPSNPFSTFACMRI